MTKIIAGIADASISAWNFVDSIMFNQLLWSAIKKRIVFRDGSIGEFWIDSGGFQYMMHGKAPALDDVIRTYREIEDFIGCENTYFIMLDKPPRRIEDSKSLSENIRLFEKFVTKYRGCARIIPVIHFYYPAINMLLALDHYKMYGTGTIAYGGIIPPILKKTRYRLPSLLGLLLLRRNWGGKIHLLGAGSPIMLYLASTIGADSADTSTWRVKAAYGNILIPGKGERNIGRAKKWGAPKATSKDLDALATFLKKTNFPLINQLENLLKTFKGRAIVNLWVITRMNPLSWGSGGFKWIEEKLKRYTSLGKHELIEEIDKIVQNIRIKYVR